MDDLANRSSGWVAAGSYLYSYGERGYGIEFTNTNGNMVGPAETVAWPSTTEGSALVVHEKVDTTARASVLFANSATYIDSAYRILAHLPYSDGTGYFDFGNNFGANRITVSGVVSMRPRAALFSGGLEGLRIVLDGRLVASSSTAVSRVSLGSSYSACINKGYGVAGDLIRVYAVFFWSRDIFLPEALSLTRNPWQVFMPPPSRLYSFPSITFNPAWARGANSVIQPGATIQ